MTYYTNAAVMTNEGNATLQVVKPYLWLAFSPNHHWIKPIIDVMSSHAK